MTTKIPYMELHEAAFATTRDVLTSSAPGKPCGVIMETGFPQGSFTLVALGPVFHATRAVIAGYRMIEESKES